MPSKYDPKTGLLSFGIALGRDQVLAAINEVGLAEQVTLTRGQMQEFHPDELTAQTKQHYLPIRFLPKDAKISEIYVNMGHSSILAEMEAKILGRLQAAVDKYLPDAVQPAARPRRERQHQFGGRDESGYCDQTQPGNNDPNAEYPLPQAPQDEKALTKNVVKDDDRQKAAAQTSDAVAREQAAPANTTVFLQHQQLSDALERA